MNKTVKFDARANEVEIFGQKTHFEKTPFKNMFCSNKVQEKETLKCILEVLFSLS